MARRVKSTQKAVVTAKAGHMVSPLAPKSFPKLPPLAGVRLATAAAGVRYKDRTDVLMALLAPGTQVAGVFTNSKTASAPVL
jgi:glutamate N-acetyltransferase / amino-acid N-acetyltransferase